MSKACLLNPPARAVLACWAAVLGLAGFAAPRPAAAASSSVLIGRPAPNFVLKGIDGNNRRLSEYRGRVVLILFYARWAGDSRLEIPALERLDTTYRRAGLVVLAVSVDSNLRRAADFAKAMRVSYPILLDAGTRIGRAYALDRLPMTVLLGRAGIVRYLKSGYERGDQRAFATEIRKLLRE